MSHRWLGCITMLSRSKEWHREERECQILRFLRRGYNFKYNFCEKSLKNQCLLPTIHFNQINHNLAGWQGKERGVRETEKKTREKNAHNLCLKSLNSKSILIKSSSSHRLAWLTACQSPGASEEDYREYGATAGGPRDPVYLCHMNTLKLTGVVKAIMMRISKSIKSARSPSWYFHTCSRGQKKIPE